MPNKKLLIALGLSLVILLSAIVYRQVRDNALLEEAMQEEELEEIATDLQEEEVEDEVEEIKSLFSSVEEKFYTLTRNIFLLGDEEVERMEGDLLKIEEKVKQAREELNKEDIDTERVYEHLSEVQEMIGELSEKLVEVEEE